MKIRKRGWSAAVALGLPLMSLFSPQVYAQAMHSAGSSMLDTVVVTASRVEQEAADVPATITAISAEQIEREMPNDLQDLMRYETGVSVRVQPNRASGVFAATGRAGNEGVNIRGLEGDQVRLQVDGVRLPSIYSSGPYSAGRGNYIDPEAFKRVEILRGSASTQFGSDGLAGAVSFMTKDPEDLLTLGKSTQFGIKTGYHSIDDSWTLVPSFAARGEQWEGMVLLSSKRGHESETGGDNDARDITRTTANPADTRSDYVLAKLVFKPDTRHHLKLSVENLERDNDAEILSFFGNSFAAAGLEGVDVSEDISRKMVKLDYNYKDASNPVFQAAHANIYHQKAENRQYGFERRTSATGWNTRYRDTLYGETATGGSFQMESNFGSDVTHRLVYGFDASWTDIESLKDGGNLRDGVPLTGSGAFTPNKSFPDTEYRLLGAFVQNEIGIGNLSIIPGVRLDSFKLAPKPDALYTDNNSAPVATLSDEEISPKLGAVWKLSPLINLFAQYSHGFRAPAPSQVNGGVTNMTATNPYTSIGNPDLKPETSDSIEVGWRGRTDALSYSASVFHGKYKNFIAGNVRVGGSGTALDPTVYQSVNLSNVKIRGFELRGEWKFMPKWAAIASYAHAKGDQTEDGISTPLDTIDPDKLIMGVRYSGERLGTQATVTAVERKKRSPYPDTAFTPAGYSVVDLTAWYKLGRNATVNVGLFNLFDKKYFQWADVRGLDADAVGLDSYSQAGRNFAVSMNYQF